MNREEFVKRIEMIRQEQEKAYAEMDLDKKLMLNIAVLGRRSHNAVDKKGGQNRVLALLKETGPMSQRDLTHRLGIQPGSASEILRKLEDAFLIERVFDENDRRGKLVKLTESGKVLADSLEGREDTQKSDVFSALNEEEKQTFLTLMEKVNKDWQTRFPMGPEAHMGPPKGFGHHRPEGFGHHGPEDFGHHGPARFDRKFYGDMDRKEQEPMNREFHGDMDRKGPGDFNLNRDSSVLFAEKHRNKREDMA